VSTYQFYAAVHLSSGYLPSMHPPTNVNIMCILLRECYGSLPDVVQDGEQAVEVVTECIQYILLEGGMHLVFS